MKSFEEKYPNISAIDAGGVAWESDAKFSSMDEALSALDQGIADWCEEIGVDLDLNLKLSDFQDCQVNIVG